MGKQTKTEKKSLKKKIKKMEVYNLGASEKTQDRKAWKSGDSISFFWFFEKSFSPLIDS